MQACTRCRSACCLRLGCLLGPRLYLVCQLHMSHVMLPSCAVQRHLHENHGLQIECRPRLCQLFDIIAPADVSGHLPAVFYISCEYFDNSIKALKGIQDGSKRKIIAIFQLAKPSHPSGRVCYDACYQQDCYKATKSQVMHAWEEDTNSWELTCVIVHKIFACLYLCYCMTCHLHLPHFASL